MNIKRFLPVVLAVSLILGGTTAGKASAATISKSTNQTNTIVQPMTAYNWTQTNIGVSPFGEAQFKGPSGNNYLFDLSSYYGYDNTLKFTWSKVTASGSILFYMKLINTENGDVYYTPGYCTSSSGSVTVTIPSYDVANYKIMVENSSSSNLVIGSLNVTTVY